MNTKEAENIFEKYREALRFEAQRLISFMTLYRHLHERKTDRLAEMNLSPAFYGFTLDALFISIVLWVDKLFGDKSERGFVHFLKFIEINRKIFAISELKRRKSYPDNHWMLDREPITIETIKKDMDKLHGIEVLSSFKTRRDKFHAHFDKEYFFDKDKLSDDAPIKWNDLKKIERIMLNIINKYSASYDGNTYKLFPINIKDIDRTLDRLHRLNIKNNG